MKHLLLLLLLFPAGSYAQNFASAVPYALPSAGDVRGVALGDFNRDGYPDVVTADVPKGVVGVFLTQRDGTLAPVVTYSTNTPTRAYGPYAVATGDMNKDGYVDIVVSTGDTYAVEVLLNKGDGSFATPTDYAAGARSGPYALAVGDVNQDGYADVVTANSGGAFAAGVFLNRGDGTLAPPVTYAAGLSSQSAPHGISIGDVNNDGYVDLVTSNSGDHTVGVFLSQRNGTFASASLYDTGTKTQPTAVALADVNADAYLDIVTANSTNASVSVLLNQQNGTFASVNSYSTGANSYTQSLATGDVDGDGYADLLTANSYNQVGVLLNRKNGTFASVRTYAGGGDGGLASGDLNKDGKVDMVALDAYRQGVAVFLNTTGAPLATRPGQVQGLGSVHPNPATGPASFSAVGLPAEATHLRLTVTTTVGQVVQHWRVAVVQGGAQSAWSTNGLSTGIYLLQASCYNAQGEAIGTLPVQRVEVP